MGNSPNSDMVVASSVAGPTMDALIVAKFEADNLVVDVGGDGGAAAAARAPETAELSLLGMEIKLGMTVAGSMGLDKLTFCELCFLNRFLWCFFVELLFCGAEDCLFVELLCGAWVELLCGASLSSSVSWE